VTLAELQRALGALCLAERWEPARALALGDEPARWRVYRELVRGRMLTVLTEALPGSARALGTERMDGLLASFLLQSPPSSRYVRDLAPAFVGFVLGHPEHASELQPWDRERLAYEAAVHETAIAPEPDLAAVGAFTMDRPAVFTPALRFLRVRWDVHGGTARPEPCERALLLYREEDTGRVVTLELSPDAAALVALALPGDRDLTGCVRAILATRDGPTEARWLEGLVELLATWLDQGVLLGSTAPSNSQKE
jgi:hypothetical protein